VDLTGEQRPLLASSDVEVSVNDLQNQLENLIGPSTVYRRVPKTIITKNSERINPIFCMKGGIMSLHVVSLCLACRRI